MDVESIKNKADFLVFLEKFQLDLKENSGKWENPTLDRFLEAFAAYTNDAEIELDWKSLAILFTAASVYE